MCYVIQRALSQTLRDALDLYHQRFAETVVRIVKLESLGISIEQTVWSLIMTFFGFALIYIVPLAFRYQYWQVFIGILNATLLGKKGLNLFARNIYVLFLFFRHGDGIGYDSGSIAAKGRRAYATCATVGQIEEVEEYCKEELERAWRPQQKDCPHVHYCGGFRVSFYLLSLLSLFLTLTFPLKEFLLRRPSTSRRPL